MPKMLVLVFTFCFMVLSVRAGAKALETGGREKVLLDTDMVEGFDDGVAMMLLANAPNVDLVGVTIVAGNSWVAEGTAYAIRQLEILGRDDIPVYMGMTRPSRAGRAEGLEFEKQIFGFGDEIYTGAMQRPDPENWREFYQTRYGREPENKPGEIHAVNYIIDTVRNNPGEITIVAIGPLGNIATAVRMAPDIVPLVKKVVYMGGAFFQRGNVTPSAEFNWWFDAEAARSMVRSPFREQIIFSLDACEKVKFTSGHFSGILKMLDGTERNEKELKQLLMNSDVGRDFVGNPNSSSFIWDALAAASLIEPSLGLSFEKRNVDVIDEFGPSYGQSLAFDGDGPVGTQKVTIVTDINKDRLWEMLLDKKSWLP